MIKAGDKFGSLTIIGFSHKDKSFRKYFDVVCLCGNTSKVRGSAMVNGNTKSCGCQGSRRNKKHLMLPDNLGIKRYLIHQYKRHARDRGLKYEISELTFIELIAKDCHYCGLPPSNLVKTPRFKKGYLYNGIDRVNSKAGYIEGNCVPCCGTCNKAKLSMSKDDFLKWVARVYNYSIVRS